jgi:hypothetical protein
VLFACKQTKTENGIPQPAISAFQKLHPNAVGVKWGNEAPTFEAKFSEGAMRGAVSFDSLGTVVETELVIESTQLPNPQLIADYVRDNYPGERIQRCEKVTKNDGTITYEIQITGKELVFDAQEKFLNEEPD